MTLGLMDFIIVVLLSLFIFFIVLCVILVKTTTEYPVIERSANEKLFSDNKSASCPFPSLDDPWSVNLSVIVPAYDEALRLPPMLEECLDFLETRCKENNNFSYEVIIVSDGSKDRTVKVASEFSNKYSSDIIRVLNLEKNRGKGGAVRLGIMSSRGAALLFADADGATRFADLTQLEDELKNLIHHDYTRDANKASLKEGLVCGSRAHLEGSAAVAERSVFRNFLMHGFHALVKATAVRSVRDTQCGFKLMTRSSARRLFSSLHVQRWAFDVELLYIAERLKIPIAEVPVNWTEIDGRTDNHQKFESSAVRMMTLLQEE